MKIIESGVKRLRDPFVLNENGVLYMFGTGWVMCRNATERLDSGWEDAVKVVDMSKMDDIAGDCWAPEVHKYNGGYYMFTTYRSKATGHRGCTILRADKPDGMYKPHSRGQVTPHDWDSIDATLYIDKGGKPWMVFVHEWTCTDDGVGRFAAARLSDDLTELISEPVELFRADSPDWTNYHVTDGCFMYTTASGSLLMLWSNFAPDGYAVGIARSLDGRVDGEWKQENLIYSKTLSGCYDGGHGMIFEFGGDKYLSIHSPNSTSPERSEMPIFVRVEEKGDTLTTDL